MLDVCFLLLVFFVLTASFTQTEGILPAYLPSGTGVIERIEPPTPTLTVYLRPGAGSLVEYWLDGHPQAIQTSEELYSRLNDLKERVYGRTSAVELKPSAQVSWNQVVNAFDQTVRAGYADVRFSQPVF